jgi:3-oxoacyl-[acyl-carrier-protein] synthase-3
MAARIVATGCSTDVSTRGAIAHAVAAARACLASVDVAADTIDLLVWAGVYRDENIVEPAIAALVQRELGICLDYTKTRRAAFSFDLQGGACGLLQAVDVVAAYIEAGAVSRALVVGSDAHPSNAAVVDGFPHAACGGALLLCSDEASPLAGPSPVAGRLFVRDEDDAVGGPGDPGVEGFLSFEQAGNAGRRHVTVIHGDAVEDRSAVLLAACVRDCLAASGAAPGDVTIVASGPGAGLARRLGAALGVDAGDVVTAEGIVDGAHTAALPLAWQRVPATSRAGRPLVLASVGAGLTAACMLVRPGGR